MIRESKENRGRRVGGARGEAQIEFILTLVTIMFVIFWMFELIMAVYATSVLSDAAKEGVRCAILHGTWQASPAACLPGNPSVSNPTGLPTNCPDVTGLVTYYAKASLHDISGMTVSVSYPADTSPAPLNPCLAGNRVRVDVTYPLVPYFKFAVKPTLHAAAEGRFIF